MRKFFTPCRLVWKALALLLINVSLCSTIAAETKADDRLCMPCNGTLTGNFSADIIVSGGNCILDNATVTASIVVRDGGQLTVQNGSAICGNIKSNRGGSIELKDDSIVLGNVMVNNSGDITVSGEIGSLQVYAGSGAIEVLGATIYGGACINGFTGDVVVADNSIIDGAIYVSEGDGNIIITDAMLTSADIIVLEQTGNVLVDGSSFSDIYVGELDGDLALFNVMGDSDASFYEVSGVVFLGQSTFDGDVELKENNIVLIVGNDFSLEDVSISRSQGQVVIEQNQNLGLELSKNDGIIAIENNTNIDLKIDDNNGGVIIAGNSGEKLDCNDNSPFLNCVNNDFDSTDGQCADCGVRDRASTPVDNVNDLLEEALSDKRLMLECFPNPFTDKTTIHFVLPEATDVTVSVIDLLGKSSVLASGYYESGRHALRLDIGQLIHGSYMLRLQAGNLSKMKRIVLEKE